MKIFSPIYIRRAINHQIDLYVFIISKLYLSKFISINCI